MNSRNTTKMFEHKLVLFETVIALWTLVTLLIKLIRIILKWKYIKDQNYATFGRDVVRAKLFCLKSFVLVTGLCSNGKIFILNQASPASHMNTSIFLQRKEW